MCDSQYGMWRGGCVVEDGLDVWRMFGGRLNATPHD